MLVLHDSYSTSEHSLCIPFIVLHAKSHVYIQLFQIVHFQSLKDIPLRVKKLLKKYCKVIEKKLLLIIDYK